MKYLNVMTLLVWAAVAAAVGWSLNQVLTGAGQALLILQWGSLLAEVAVGLVVLYLGLRVRAYRDPDSGGRGRKPAERKPYDPVWAVGTAAAAQAIAYYGSLTAGWHLGLGVDQVLLLSVRSTQVPLWQCVAQVVAGILLALTGWLVEHWCRLPPDDPDAEEDRGYGSPEDPYPTGEGGYARHR